MEDKGISEGGEHQESYLDMNARHEINQSIENLKNTLINNLEKVLRRTSMASNSTDSQEKSSQENREADDGDEISHNQLENGAEDGGSCRDLARGYLRQRSSVLKTIARVASQLPLSTGVEEDDDTSSRMAQQKMRIWTDVAIDLDGYYLELLNRYLRTGQKTSRQIKGGTLLTSRLSESTVDDLNRSKRKQMFYSRQDVHDDAILGQLQEPFGVDNPTVCDFIEDLLIRTNAQRQNAVCFFESEATSENETVSSKFDNCVEMDDWRESVGAENDFPEKKFKEPALDQARREEVSNHENSVANLKIYVEEQSGELNNRKVIIEKLTEENLELIGALENVQEYEAKMEKESEMKIAEAKRDYECQLEQKDAVINELMKKLSEVIESKKADQEEEECCSERNVRKLDFGKLGQCFEDTCSQLKVLALVANDCGASLKENNTEVSEKVSENIVSADVNDDLLARIIHQLVQFCRKINCLEGEQTEMSDIKPSSKEFFGDLLKKISQAFEEKDKKIRDMESKAETFNQDFHKTKLQLMKARSRLKALLAHKQVQDIQIAEKDEIISAQTEILNQKDLELAEVRSQNESLKNRITSLLDELSSAQEHVVILEEELRQAAAVEQERCAENERLVDCLVDMDKMVSGIGSPKRRATEQSVTHCESCLSLTTQSSIDYFT